MTKKDKEYFTESELEEEEEESEEEESSEGATSKKDAPNSNTYLISTRSALYFVYS
jgi:hypothetical protein